MQPLSCMVQDSSAEWNTLSLTLPSHHIFKSWLSCKLGASPAAAAQRDRGTTDWVDRAAVRVLLLLLLLLGLSRISLNGVTLSRQSWADVATG